MNELLTCSGPGHASGCPGRLMVLIAMIVAAGTFELRGADPVSGAEMFRFGAHARTIDGLASPSAVALDRKGRLLVAEADAAIVRRIDPVTGVTLAVFSGPLARPVSVATDGGHRIYVADADRDRIEVFADHGPHLFGFGRRGRDDGAMMEPRSVIVHDDRVYVADAGNARVQVFSPEGVLLEVLSSDRLGGMERPAGIAIMGERLVVSDSDAHRIVTLPLRGGVPTMFGERGPFTGLLDEPGAMAVHGNELFVLETSNHRVQSFVFRPGGEADAASAFGVHAVLPREGEGRFHYPTGLVIGAGADGRMIGVIAEPIEDRVQIFDAYSSEAPGAEEPWDPAMLPRQTHFGRRFAIDGPLLLVPETEAHVLRLFDIRAAVPILIGEFGERGRTSGLYDRPTAVAVDFEARVMDVGDETARRIDRLEVTFDDDEPRGFSPRRIRLRSSSVPVIPGDGSDAGPVAPAVFARFADGTSAVLDARRREVVLVDAMHQVYGRIGDSSDLFIRPVDIAVTADQRLLIVDAGARAVLIMNRSGALLGRLEDDRYLLRPGGAAEAADGRIYVSDERRSCIVVFGPDGAYERSFGGPGMEPGELWKPAGVAFDDRNRLFVLDYGNHRMQIFTDDGRWQVVFGTGRAFVSREAVR